MPSHTATPTVVANVIIPNSDASWTIGSPNSSALVTAPVIAPTILCTDYIKFTGFGFSIASNESIVGIQIVYPIVGVPSTTGRGKDNSLILTLASSADRANSGVNYSIFGQTPQTRGGASDLWGFGSIANSLVNTSTFGFELSAIMTGSGNVNFTMSNLPSLTIFTTILPSGGVLAGGGIKRNPPLRFN